MNKIKEKIIKYKSDILFLIICILIFFILTYPVPYYITMGGGVINLNDKVEIKNSYIKKGSINSAYVKEANGRVITYLLSFIIPKYEKEKIEEVTLPKEDIKNYEKREVLSFDTSLDKALIVAYKNANKEIEYQQKMYITYIEDKETTNLSVGDVIDKINDITVTNINDIKEMLLNTKEDTVKITLDNKEEKYAKISRSDNQLKLGIAIDYKYETNIKDVKFLFNEDEQGPSAGLMLSLTIYNKISDNDITCGKEIAGTGTIDIDGNVGEIGGVKEKLIGADEEDMDIFLVPSNNYEEAKKCKEENNLKIKIVKVNTFQEAIEKLSCK